jgi:site-specific DNA recombinase
MAKRDDTSMKQAAVYLRVSTEDQNPENQRTDVMKLADALRYKVVKVYIDKDSGGYSDRKEFQQMISDAESEKFQMVFIWALDRFSREGAGTTLTYIERLRKAGVALKSYQEQWIDTSDEGNAELTISIIAWQAKQEHKRIRERSMAGKRERLSQGKMIGCYPPYGYIHIRRDKGSGTDAYFKVNTSEALVVKKIFGLYLKLESMFMVAKRLSEMGIKSRGKGSKPKFFHTSMIKKILSNETYIGNWFYGKSSPCEAKFHINKVRKHRLTGRRMNPKSEWTLIKIPAIIDNETFDRAQQILKKRYRQRGKESKFPVLCKGLIRCVDCGRLYGAKKQRQSRIYRCPQVYGLDFNQPHCHSRSMMCHKLDAIVWNYISNLIQDKERVKASIRLLKERGEKDKVGNQKTYDILLSEKEGLKTKTSRLLELYAGNEFSKEDLRAKIAEVKDREAALDNQIKDIKKEIRGIEDLETTEREVEKLCILYQNNISHPNLELQRYVVRKWVKEINLLKDGKIVIKVNLPEMELPSNLSVCPMTTYPSQGRQKVIKSY